MFLDDRPGHLWIIHCLWLDQNWKVFIPKVVFIFALIRKYFYQKEQQCNERHAVKLREGGNQKLVVFTNPCNSLPMIKIWQMAVNISVAHRPLKIQSPKPVPNQFWGVNYTQSPNPVKSVRLNVETCPDTVLSLKNYVTRGTSNVSAVDGREDSPSLVQGNPFLVQRNAFFDQRNLFLAVIRNQSLERKKCWPPWLLCIESCGKSSSLIVACLISLN